MAAKKSARRKSGTTRRRSSTRKTTGRKTSARKTTGRKTTTRKSAVKPITPPGMKNRKTKSHVVTATTARTDRKVYCSNEKVAKGVAAYFRQKGSYKRVSARKLPRPAIVSQK